MFAEGNKKGCDHSSQGIERTSVLVRHHKGVGFLEKHVLAYEIWGKSGKSES